MDTKLLLRALQDVEKRAERASVDHVVATYVDSGALVNALQSKDNGVVFGRRGTGKTHALKYLAETERAKGNFVVFIDMEKDTGSTEGRYVDQTLSVAERATRLLVDVLTIVHDQLIEDAFEGRSQSQIDLLDRAFDHFGEIVVAQEVGVEEGTATTAGQNSRAAASLTPTAVALHVGEASRTSSERSSNVTVRGPIRHRVHFGALGAILKRAFEEHDSNRCWIVIDEWSAVPLDLQPYLAQMLRSLFFGLPKVTVRLGAISHRSELRIAGDRGDYIGLEMGAEIFPLLDLDEFVVFPARNKAEQTERSMSFFKALIFRHLQQALRDQEGEELDDPDQMVRLLFTQVTALQEAIRAAEGVPRDALSIVTRAALRAGESRIGTPNVRDAAAQLYQTTKAAQLNAVPEARALLDAIIGSVLNGRKARAFLLSQAHTSHPLIQLLVDDRILHLIKKGYSGKDDPGRRFDVLEIDYGCYVGLLGTTAAPQHLFGDGTTNDDTALEALYGDVTVPEDDYRAIRRAVLDLDSVLAQIGFTTEGETAA